MATRRSKNKEGELPENSKVVEMMDPSDGEPEETEQDDNVRKADQSTWEYLDRFTPEDWQWLIGYLYRTMPVIDLKAAGRPPCIRKIAEKFDQAWILQNFGSGGYKLELCTVAPGRNKKGNRLSVEYFEVYDPAYPPKVEYGDWVEHPDNKNWSWGAVKPAAPGQPPPSPMAAAREGTSLLKDALELANHLKPADNSQFLIEELRESRKEIRELQRPAAAPPPDNSFQQFMMEEWKATRAELAEARKEAAAAAARVNQAPAVAPKSDIDTLLESGDKIEKIAGVFGFKRGRGSAEAAAPQNDWMALGMKAIEHLGPLAGAAINYFTRPAPRTQAQMQQPQPNGDPAMQQPQPDQATALPQDKYSLMMEFVRVNENIIRKAAPILVDHFTSGQSGHDFRDWFIDRLGFSTWMDFRKNLGPEGMADACSQNSYFSDINPREKAIAWFTEVFEDPKADQDGEGEEPAAGENPSVGVLS